LEGVDNNLKRHTARLSVISNSLLVILKLVVGFYTGAVSIISEAAHSGVDLIAALIAYFAVRKSCQPPDEGHAYGHGKFENVAAAAEAVLIVVAAVWIVYESAEKLLNSPPLEYIELGITLMMISIVVNYWVSKRLFQVAQATCSHALEADALHLQADIWTSGGVLLGLAVIRITGLYWIDPLIALGVAGFVFKAGYTMTKKSLAELTDASLPEGEEEKIREIINRHPDVIAFHRLRTRRSGSYRLVDVHIILYKDMHLDKAHDICDQLEEEIQAHLVNCDVVIHIEPGDHHAGFGACLLKAQEEKSE